MNQILISEKVYITPELKRRKKMYKIDFFISVFLVFILSSYYIYAEYDKNKNEAKSHEILSSVSFGSNLVDDTTIKFEENATLVILNNDESSKVVIVNTAEEEQNEEEMQNNALQQFITENTLYTESGEAYYLIAKINIPSISCNYGIACKIDSERTWSDSLLKVFPCYYHGAKPNQPGNFCVVGHNYRNTRFFSKVPTLENGDVVEITDLTGNTVQYYVYDKYIVEPSDVNCTSQLTNGKTEITIITCTNDSERRVVVKARMMGE